MAAALDIRVPSLKDKVSPEEWQQRVDLAATYRLVHHYGWDDMIFTHISARVPGPEHHFLINPYGLLFDEITASNLVKIDMDGKKVEESPYPVNPAGFTIHSAIHGAREDAKCVIHLHSTDGVRGFSPRNTGRPNELHVLDVIIIARVAGYCIGRLCWQEHARTGQFLEKARGPRGDFICRKKARICSGPSFDELRYFRHGRSPSDASISRRLAANPPAGSSLNCSSWDERPQMSKSAGVRAQCAQSENETEQE